MWQKIEKVLSQKGGTSFLLPIVCYLCKNRWIAFLHGICESFSLICMHIKWLCNLPSKM